MEKPYKAQEGEPIGALRYYGGCLLFVSFHMGLFLFLTVLSVPVPRYRKTLSFYRDYTRESVRSVLKREGIRVTRNRGTS